MDPAKIIAPILAALCLSSSAVGSINLIGLEGDLEHHSEFLFGFSGGFQGVLRVGVGSGGFILITTGFQQGWWSPTNANGDSNTNYIVGDLSSDGTELFNNFFSFNLSSLLGQSILSADLQLRREFGASSSGQTQLFYSLFDVSTPTATLNANDGTSQSIYDDLGSGVIYGTFSVAVSGATTDILTFPLNSAFVADLSSAVSTSQEFFSIGGTLTPGDPAAVPEAASVLVWGGLIAATLLLRRQIKTTPEC